MLLDREVTTLYGAALAIALFSDAIGTGYLAYLDVVQQAEAESKGPHTT